MLLQFWTPAKRCSGRSGNSPFQERSRRQPVAFARQKRWRGFVFWAKTPSQRIGPKSAKRTVGNSPAIYRRVQSAIKEVSPRSGPQKSFPSVAVARFTGSGSRALLSLEHWKCWAVFVRPLRGLKDEDHPDWHPYNYPQRLMLTHA